MASLTELKNELVKQCQLIVNYKFDNQDVQMIKQLLAPIVRKIELETDYRKEQRRWRN